MKVRVDGHATAMAGEFYVMEKLFRLGHSPALTLGNAKKIDILLETRKGRVFTINVKAIRGGDKWGVGRNDLTTDLNLFFVFLYYKNFSDILANPEAYIVPAKNIEIMKRTWHDQFAIYLGHKNYGVRAELRPYANNWSLFDS